MIKVEVISEIATSLEPARARIVVEGNVVAEVVATIEKEKGADGGLYDVVKLTKKILTPEINIRGTKIKFPVL